jgi:hypothetical protein
MRVLDPKDPETRDLRAIHCLCRGVLAEKLGAFDPKSGQNQWGFVG